jgi:hypothetical protein
MNVSKGTIRKGLNFVRQSMTKRRTSLIGGVIVIAFLSDGDLIKRRDMR